MEVIAQLQALLLASAHSFLVFVPPGGQQAK